MIAAVCGCCSCTAITASCCCKGSKDASPRTAKVLYMVFLSVAGLIALALNLWGNDIPSYHFLKTIYIGCAKDGLHNCFGTQAVYRVSFASAVFFLLMIPAALNKSAHLGLWGAKAIFWLVLIIASFFIPYNFEEYAEISRWVSFGFLCAQAIVLIDMAYTLHEAVMEKIEAVNAKYADTHDSVGLCQNPWSLLYLLMVLVLQVGSYAVLIGLYVFSSKSGHHCGNNNLFLSITLIFGLLYTVGAIWTGRTGLLTPSVILAYTTWLCWSAIANSPSAACNPMYHKDDGWSVAAGVVVALVSLSYTCYSATSSFPGLSDARSPQTEESGMQQSLITSSDVEQGETKDEEPKADASSAATPTAGDAQAPHYYYFHIIMVTGAMYMAMVLTDWTVSATAASSVVTLSKKAMWIQAASQWVTILTFTMSLVAPKLFLDREF